MDQLNAALRQPAVAVILWSLFALLSWRKLPRRIRVLGVAFVSPIVALGFEPLVEYLQPFSGSIVVSFAEASYIFALFMLLFGPLVVVIDRLSRPRLDSLSAARPWLAYLAASATGLGACLASLGALWWVTDVHREIGGSVDLALLGGVLTGCVSLARADRRVDRATSGAALN